MGAGFSGRFGVLWASNLARAAFTAPGRSLTVSRGARGVRLGHDLLLRGGDGQGAGADLSEPFRVGLAEVLGVVDVSGGDPHGGGGLVPDSAGLVAFANPRDAGGVT